MIPTAIDALSASPSSPSWLQGRSHDYSARAGGAAWATANQAKKSRKGKQNKLPVPGRCLETGLKSPPALQQVTHIPFAAWLTFSAQPGGRAAGMANSRPWTTHLKPQLPGFQCLSGMLRPLCLSTLSRSQHPFNFLLLWSFLPQPKKLKVWTHSGSTFSPIPSSDGCLQARNAVHPSL